MKKIKIALVSLVLFNSSFCFARTLVSCNSDNKVGVVDLRLENEARSYLDYKFLEETFSTEMEAVSGSELMGFEGENIIFFELLPSGQYFFNIFSSSLYEYVLEPVYLNCSEN